MVAKQDLKFLKHLLSSIYDPANDSPPKFIQNYNQLLHHRDSLDQQYHDKERKRAAMKRAEGQCLSRKSSLRHAKLTVL